MNSGSKSSFSIGLDYSKDALKLCKDALNSNEEFKKHNILFCRANCKNIPIKNDSIDKIFLLDIIEHLYPYELKILMKEVHRILSTKGKIIIHTNPNSWSMAYIYFLAKIFNIHRSKYGMLHVNEQNILSIKNYLRDAGFIAKVWVEADINFFEAILADKKVNKFIKYFVTWVVRLFNNKITNVIINKSPLVYLFGNDIYAIAQKIMDESD